MLTTSAIGHRLVYKKYGANPHIYTPYALMCGKESTLTLLVCVQQKSMLVKLVNISHLASICL